MKWFSGQPTTPACEDAFNERVDVPVGWECVWCEEPIEAGQRGFMIPHLEGERGKFHEVAYGRPWHHECFIRSIIGSVGHQMHVCSCYGGYAGDPEGMTKRQAAIAAFILFTNRQEFRV